MTKSDETLEVITKVFAAFDAHDLDAFHDLLAPDAVFVIGGGDTTLVGQDSIVDAVRPTLEALPDLKVSIRNAFADGERGVAEVMREGVNKGPIRLPDGTVKEPTGRKVRLPECIVFEVREGRVVRMVPYVDMLDTFEQFGLLAGARPGAG